MSEDFMNLDKQKIQKEIKNQVDRAVPRFSSLNCGPSTNTPDLRIPVSEIDHILEDRGKRYGKFKSQAKTAQDFKQIMRAHWSDSNKAPVWDLLNNDQKEALDMITHKIARILNGDPNYKDSWTDIAGYATLVANELKDED